MAGVSISTASLAFRNDPRIPESTRLKVQAAARKLGYAINPKLSQLMASVRGNKQTAITICLVLPSRQEPPLFMKSTLSGIRDRAHQLGFQLEEIPPRKDHIHQLMMHIHSGKTDGVIFAEPLATHDELATGLQTTAALAIGYPQGEPQVHTVTIDHYDVITKAMNILGKRGYSRIGLYCSQRTHERSAGNLLRVWSAYHGRHTQTGKPIEALLYDSAEKRDFERWYRQIQPDAILVEGLSSTVIQWLQEMRISVPEDTAIADLHLTTASKEVAGVRQFDYELGGMAVDTLSQYIHLKIPGITPLPRISVIDTEWVDGPTMA